MIVLMFRPEFARMVESGRKRQTVRLLRRRAIQVGDHVSLREWTGAAYRSKQRELRRAAVRRLENIVIVAAGIYMMNELLSWEETEEFARADGFVNAGQMLSWFGETHGFPFVGQVIHW